MLPLRLLQRRVFVGGDLVWLLACLTSTGAFSLVAGLALVPLYLVMTFGSPLSGKLADRIGSRLPTLAGLVVYSAGLWLLSGIGPGSELVSDVLPGLIVLASGTAMFGPPLTTATLGALDDADQGIASGTINAVGQFGGLLAIAVLPAAAGLSNTMVGGPAFAAGHTHALRIAAGIAAAATILAAATLRRRRPPALDRRGGPSDFGGPARVSHEGPAAVGTGSVASSGSSGDRRYS